MTPSQPDRHVHLLISGRVQGVFYRASLQDKARALDLKGWCRNLPDGRVEAEAIGSASDVAELIDWCYQGPPQAKVDEVLVEDKPLGVTEVVSFEVCR